MADKKKRDESGEAFERFDRLFKGVVSVSNKAVQEKMKEEKRKRARKRKVR